MHQGHHRTHHPQRQFQQQTLYPHPYPWHLPAELTYGPPRPARPPLGTAQPALVLSAVALVAAVLATVVGLLVFGAMTTGVWDDGRGSGSGEADGYLLVMLMPGIAASVVMTLGLLAAGVLYRVVAVGMSRERQWARVTGFVLAGLGLLGSLSLGQIFSLPVVAFGMALSLDPLYLMTAALLTAATLLWAGYFGTTVWWIVAAARATPGGRSATPSSSSAPKALVPAPMMGATSSGS
ncbi:hypothetical protein [Nesterenkonia marinintestina]|uniref:hypothetical protein n=1 Tax=Nesterenkonia marinintestina TaxID=2979865 RepID=UPI0021BF19BA|nr:hypothetical protein [Nesterenkonia sp. GX14115]